jgi:hypothetical protein
MGYRVEGDRLNKRSRLVYYATVHRKRIGLKGTRSRRVVKLANGREYHVTKGWR